ncbi:MAG: radical SAM family heme chaperone HemW [Corallococcus sp.]|nr:radical SAM family heme chaperone HemW [Corallococcus sp.]MCM1359131.1 radical SAM family heme chaperone HemW [Corallococcus sp.]MCM1394521.1 radical SAM family heme chaperone HemW [Corallococcus sp.]
MQTPTDYGIYVHFPFCKARCGYCAFSSCTDFALQGEYFDALCREIANADVPFNARIVTMYWGGGTPSAVEFSYLEKVYRALSEKFDLSSLKEFTVECNPESVTIDLLRLLRDFGVNRLSFGLQSANDPTLKKIGRIHTYGEFLRSLKLAHECGFSNVSSDLILGLPEDPSDFRHTIEHVVSLPLNHVSLYALEIHPHAPIAKLCAEYAYADDDLADMYDYALSRFAQNGLFRYEVSNFARTGFECLHNLGYWTERRYFAFGAAASGFVNDARYTNLFAVSEYVKSGGVDSKADFERISLDEESREYVMLGLRLERGISLEDFVRRFGTNFFLRFSAANKLVSDGFLCSEDGRVFVRRDKFYVLNSILTELL